VVIGPGGEIESPAMAGQEAIPQLVDRAARPALPVVYVEQGNGHANGTAAARRHDTAPLDRPAPALTLTDLDGRAVELAELYDSPTLAIFWNPHCGFCERMLPDLKAFEDDPPAGAPRLVVISSGDREATRAHQLRSRVLLDSDSSAAAAFDAHGTPMGVLIQDGRIIAPVAAGAEAVFALARARSVRRNGHGR
jgi:thiol-disulfide isomerase/thioredoxin